jgi:hypothetical protein
MDVPRPQHVDEDELQHRADDPPDESDRKHDDDERYNERRDLGKGLRDAGGEVALSEGIPGGVRETYTPSHEERNQGQAEPEAPPDRPEQAFGALEGTIKPAECIHIFSHVTHKMISVSLKPSFAESVSGPRPGAVRSRVFGETDFSTP